VDEGRSVGAALRHLDVNASAPDAQDLADALARFLVARCDSHHVGWRMVRQVVVDSAADAPWEKCARRAVRTPLARAQHIAARRRAEEIAAYVNQGIVLADLGLDCSEATPDAWSVALGSAVGARSRDQVARAVERSIRGGTAPRRSLTQS
jgi:hypothetical protein